MPYTNDLTDDKVNHFFNTEIGTLEATMAKLREEGVEILEDLAEFNAEDAISVADYLMNPGG